MTRSPSGRRRYAPTWPVYSRRRRRLTGASVVIGALLLITTVASGRLRSTADLPAVPAGPLAIAQRDGGWFIASGPGSPSEATRVAVDRVIDGDTIDVVAAQERLRVRFYGIDTPERGQPCFSEATARTTALVGREVVLVPDARLQDRNGRELRYVFGTDGRSIDATLIAEGLALAWRDDGVLRDRLVAIEDGARAAKRGCLWAGR